MVWAFLKIPSKSECPRGELYPHTASPTEPPPSQASGPLVEGNQGIGIATVTLACDGKAAGIIRLFDLEVEKTRASLEDIDRADTAFASVSVDSWRN
jgi:hypothetical protein